MAKKLLNLLCLLLLLLGPAYGQTVIPVDEIDRVLTESQPFVLDVRTPEEIAEHGTLPGALNIPEDQIAERLEELPRDRPIVVA
jgi:rhodanese-related sulfurtransferase